MNKNKKLDDTKIYYDFIYYHLVLKHEYNQSDKEKLIIDNRNLNWYYI